MMSYAWADILLFILLLAGLWFVLFRLYIWWATRRERRENDEIIRQIENGLNKTRK
jgi:uncharacterized protein YggT (Ycf19 family)